MRRFFRDWTPPKPAAAPSALRCACGASMTAAEATSYGGRCENCWIGTPRGVVRDYCRSRRVKMTEGKKYTSE